MKRTVIGLIPARLGSIRVKCKNLRMIGGKPLIAYTIDTLKHAKNFDEIYVNSESDLIGKVATRYGIPFYKRPKELALSSSMIDDYIYEFLTNKPHCDVLAVINPTSPFITAEEMDRAVTQFLNSDCHTQLCCEAIQTHCFVDGQPVNFSTGGQHPRSQDIPPVHALNFAITIWDAAKFKETYEAKGYGVYSGKLGFFVTEGKSSIDIDYPEDFAMARVVMDHWDEIMADDPQYDPVLDQIIAENRKTEC